MRRVKWSTIAWVALAIVVVWTVVAIVLGWPVPQENPGIVQKP